MMSRRRFLLEVATAGVAWSGIDTLTVATGTSAAAMTDFGPYRVIYESRIEQCLEFARQAARRGLVTTAIDGDLCGLWRQVLQPQLRQRPASFVGLTTDSSLFCLSELVKDHWMRVRVRAPVHPLPPIKEQLVSWMIVPRTGHAKTK
jgi:hypothetical protein